MENSGCAEISRIQIRAAIPQIAPPLAPHRTANHTGTRCPVASRCIRGNWNSCCNNVRNALEVAITPFLGESEPPNGLAFSCRERATTSLQKKNDLAREAV